VPAVQTFVTTSKSKLIKLAKHVVGFEFRVLDVPIASADDAKFVQVIDYLAEYGAEYQKPSEVSYERTDQILLEYASKVELQDRKVLLKEYVQSTSPVRVKKLMESKLIYELI
jgi:hypothetical protein